MGLPLEIEYGGPDRPVGGLGKLLLERVRETPSGGSIDWVTYYFRDRRIADALLEARDRGVRVGLIVAGKPRTSDANAAAIASLSGPDGLGEGLRVITMPGIGLPKGRSWRPQIHEKLYCFSHPSPVAYIGSYNPATDECETRPDIIKEIGDHDYSHNILIGLMDEYLVGKLIEHARTLHLHPPGLLFRFSRYASEDITHGDNRIYFWPRLSPHPVMEFLNALGKGARVRIAASHIRSSKGVRCIANLAKRGAEVNLITESTYRRVTEGAERKLLSSGVIFKRCFFEDDANMHLKFVLVEAGDKQWSISGSFNWTNPSFFLNHEIALLSQDARLFRSLDDCWDRLVTQTAEK